jgi:TolB-like protein
LACHHELELTAGVIADLMRFDGMQVFAGSPGSQEAAELPPAASGAPSYVVLGTVERGPDRARVTARLVDGHSQQILWSETYDRALTCNSRNCREPLSAAWRRSMA